jgi:hypothetical protein
MTLRITGVLSKGLARVSVFRPLPDGSRSRGPMSDSRLYHIFGGVVLEQGPLSLIRISDENLNEN